MTTKTVSLSDVFLCLPHFITEDDVPAMEKVIAQIEENPKVNHLCKSFKGRVDPEKIFEFEAVEIVSNVPKDKAFEFKHALLESTKECSDMPVLDVVIQ